MDDPDIIALYFARDEAAISQTAAKYGAYCYDIANHILENHEDSQECVSDTWLSAWNAIPPNRPSHFKLFLARITRNFAFNRFNAQNAVRRGGRETVLALDELAEVAADKRTTEGAFEAKELSCCISRFLHTLPERDCSIFLKRYFYVLPVREIALQHGLSEKHASAILSRTRKKLEKYLKQEGYMT